MSGRSPHFSTAVEDGGDPVFVVVVVDVDADDVVGHAEADVGAGGVHVEPFVDVGAEGGVPMRPVTPSGGGDFWPGGDGEGKPSGREVFHRCCCIVVGHVHS